MVDTTSDHLDQIARDLKLPVNQVHAVAELLDDGNTVPFITRYRKDQTGGLDEEQIRSVHGRLVRLRMLAERKQTILRSIDSQGKLTDELRIEIEAADTMKRLEDLYLPYKPRKQTLATTARERGLEPLAREILAADTACADLDARAADFVNPDRQVKSPADALLGVGHILAEIFSERADLRGRLRAILHKTGKLTSAAIITEAPASDATPADAGDPNDAKAPQESAPEAASPSEPQPPGDASTAVVDGANENGQSAETGAATPESPPASTECVADASSEQSGQESAPPTSEAEQPDACKIAEPLADATSKQAVELTQTPASVDVAPDAPPPAMPPEQDPGCAAPEAASDSAESGGSVNSAADEQAAPAGDPSAPATATATAEQPAPTAKAVARTKPKKPAKSKKEKKKQDLTRAFRDYFDYSEAIGRIPPHRVLAINRGERAKVLRIKIECDLEAMQRTVDEMLVPPEHPHADFLRGCARDALVRLVLPSLEREARRELTDKAEAHAVEVFARNLRKLLLQPPVRGRSVLAVDPGYKSGCKLAALDEFGNLLGHGVAHLVGSDQRKAEGRALAAGMVEKHSLGVVAIGNGTACRESEKWIADILATELAGKDVVYVIVNEAGASVYSTSRLGREEFPDYDATLRGAISIGRRLQDPLSELVKIDAANIGVGMYQHDMKAKHLRDSLDEVVESCVNYVGVNLNTASPALLRYVSGLNQLTAQRLYQHRASNGPFKTRAELLSVAGIGEGTYVQAAGFLKIDGGDNPLDATWIHPESYPAAENVLQKVELTVADLADKEKNASLEERLTAQNRDELAATAGVGQLTLDDILLQLKRPGRDPRDALPPPIFKHEVLKLDDLEPGMELLGTVLNVVDFGAFVDIGLKDSGLVHVSQLADKFVQDPHEVVSVGDIVKAWVLSVDKQRRRVSLTMISPEARQRIEQQREARERRKTEQKAARQKQSQRPPRKEFARGKKGQGGGRQQQRRDFRPKPKPKPVVPITKKMVEGKEPMRTFGDLMQFYEKKHEQPDQSPDTSGDAKKSDGD